jgi:hypothetical protein
MSHTEAATCVPDAPNQRKRTQLRTPSSQLTAVIG